MEAKFNLKGAERKKLAQAVSALLETPLTFMGAPTFAYEIGGFSIDKEGTLTGPDNRGLIADLAGLYSLEPAGKSFDTEPSAGTAETPTDGSIGEGAKTDDGTLQATAGEGKELLTIEMPLEGFTDESLANLEKLVASKAALIMKAVGADSLPLFRDGSVLRFPWFQLSAGGDETAAYTQLVAALCAMAKAQKRVNAREKAAENEKFAFRVFLIRLGFIGNEYKASRKILLKNLSGNSAFRNGAPHAEEKNDE